MTKKSIRLRFSFISIVLLIALLLSISGGTVFGVQLTSSNQKKQVTLNVMLNDLGQPGRWSLLFQPALREMEARHPDMDIQIKYKEYPYEQTRTHLLAAIANQTPVDIMSIDEIWLGEFAQRGFLTDLTDPAQRWGRQKDWYEANWDGWSIQR